MPDSLGRARHSVADSPLDAVRLQPHRQGRPWAAFLACRSLGERLRRGTPVAGRPPQAFARWTLGEGLWQPVRACSRCACGKPFLLWIFVVSHAKKERLMIVESRNPDLKYPRHVREEKVMLVLDWLLEFRFSSIPILAARLGQTAVNANRFFR